MTYDDYYGLWESITDYYELRIDKNIRAERIQWPQYLIKQAMPIKRMTWNEKRDCALFRRLFIATSFA